MKPEEDKYLCVHDWRDLYGGDGSDRHDPYKSYQTFYCCKCLEIRQKSYRRDRFKLTQEFLDEFEDGESSTKTTSLT